MTSKLLHHAELSSLNEGSQYSLKRNNFPKHAINATKSSLFTCIIKLMFDIFIASFQFGSIFVPLSFTTDELVSLDIFLVWLSCLDQIVLAPSRIRHARFWGDVYGMEWL